MNDNKLTQLIVATIDEDKIATIASMVRAEEGMTDIERDNTMVLSGVGLGIEETQAHIQSTNHDNFDKLQETLRAIESQLDIAESL